MARCTVAPIRDTTGWRWRCRREEGSVIQRKLRWFSRVVPYPETEKSSLFTAHRVMSIEAMWADCNGFGARGAAGIKSAMIRHSFAL